MNRADQARANREAMPLTARIVDDFTRHFGAGQRFKWVREGELERGRRPAPVPSMDADQWLRYVRTGERPCST